MMHACTYFTGVPGMDNPVKPHYRLGINASGMLHEKAYLSIHLKHLNIFYYKTQISYLIIDITDHLHIVTTFKL
jgi:hypothetical protein